MASAVVQVPAWSLSYAAPGSQAAASSVVIAPSGSLSVAAPRAAASQAATARSYSRTRRHSADVPVVLQQSCLVAGQAAPLYVDPRLAAARIGPAYAAPVVGGVQAVTAPVPIFSPPNGAGAAGGARYAWQCAPGGGFIPVLVPASAIQGAVARRYLSGPSYPRSSSPPAVTVATSEDATATQASSSVAQSQPAADLRMNWAATPAQIVSHAFSNVGAASGAGAVLAARAHSASAFPRQSALSPGPARPAVGGVPTHPAYSAIGDARRVANASTAVGAGGDAAAPTYVPFPIEAENARMETYVPYPVNAAKGAVDPAGQETYVPCPLPAAKATAY